MNIFTRNKPAAAAAAVPDSVPAELAEAYAAATPNVQAFMTDAASQLAREAYYRRKPDAAVGVPIGPEERQIYYTDHLPALLARAEHLARLSAAKWSAYQIELSEQRSRDIAENHTCPVCGEVTRARIEPYTAPVDLALDAPRGPRMCASCAETANLLRLERLATPERRAAVSAALTAALRK